MFHALPALASDKELGSSLGVVTGNLFRCPHFKTTASMTISSTVFAFLYRSTDLPAQPVLQLTKPNCEGRDGCPICQDDH